MRPCWVLHAWTSHWLSMFFTWTDKTEIRIFAKLQTPWGWKCLPECPPPSHCGWGHPTSVTSTTPFLNTAETQTQTGNMFLVPYYLVPCRSTVLLTRQTPTAPACKIQSARLPIPFPNSTSKMVWHCAYSRLVMRHLAKHQFKQALRAALRPCGVGPGPWWFMFQSQQIPS